MEERKKEIKKERKKNTRNTFDLPKDILYKSMLPKGRKKEWLLH